MNKVLLALLAMALICGLFEYVYKSQLLELVVMVSFMIPVILYTARNLGNASYDLGRELRFHTQ